jgi:hypothetical protein
VRRSMAVPSLQIPRRTAPFEHGGSAPVNRDGWLRAARRTDAELWALALTNRASAPVEASPVADAMAATPSATHASTALEGPHVSASSNDAGVTWSLREPPSEQRARLKAEGWTFTDEAESPPKGRRVTRYLPPEPRFLSWLTARGGTASLSAIARRFNLTAAEVDVLLSRLTAVGAGLVLDHHGRGGGRRFILLRTPRQPTTPAL